MAMISAAPTDRKETHKTKGFDKKVTVEVLQDGKAVDAPNPTKEFVIRVTIVKQRWDWRETIIRTTVMKLNQNDKVEIIGTRNDRTIERWT